MLNGLVQASRLSAPDRVAALLAEQGEALGARNVTIYLIDHDQTTLVPVTRHGAPGREPLPVASTIAGRCFQDLRLLEVDQGRRVWVPLLDGLERLGVAQLEFAAVEDRAENELLMQFASLVAEIVLAKQSYGDLFHVARRRQPMSLAAEIAWTLLPPLTVGTERLVISCVIAPTYEVGGDSFDYAVDGDRARFAVFDAMGHGLDAGLLATVAVAAYRNSRRQGLELPDTVRVIDEAVGATFGPERFVTGVLADLDLNSGRLSWYSAGHPAPLLLRRAGSSRRCPRTPACPSGWGGAGRPSRRRNSWSRATGCCSTPTGSSRPGRPAGSSSARPAWPTSPGGRRRTAGPCRRRCAGSCTRSSSTRPASCRTTPRRCSWSGAVTACRTAT